mmetsp:Transcript_4155/g.7037  ORF Transcript_4155/g.7037 Transcript_4155/m.7037 type:complete len:81 (+) Transcript_4155:532-774(+)
MADSAKHGPIFHKLVDRVRFELHESSVVKERVLKSSPKDKSLQICYAGWGYFNIPVTVYFKPETGIVEPITISHPLWFDG